MTPSKTEKPLKKTRPKVEMVLEQMRQIVKVANSHQIVRGDRYLYFSIQPSQETVVFQVLLKKTTFQVIAVYNQKDNIIGYLVQFGKGRKPFIDLSAQGDGAAVFFTSVEQHGPPKLIFSDSKLRVLAFSNKDFFFSVKWKAAPASEI